jgi:hypothetical protein
MCPNGQNQQPQKYLGSIEGNPFLSTRCGNTKIAKVTIISRAQEQK